MHCMSFSFDIFLRSPNLIDFDWIHLFYAFTKNLPTERSHRPRAMVLSTDIHERYAAALGRQQASVCDDISSAEK